MLALRVSSYGMDAIVAGMRDLGAAIEDFTPAWPDVRRALAGAFAQQFRTEGAHGLGTQWHPLSDRYARWKARHYPGRKILELTGRLRSSFSDPGHPDEVVQESAKALWVGSAVGYAQYHQYGEGRRYRPIVALTNRDAAEIGMAVHRKVHRDVNKSLIGRIAAEGRRRYAGVT